MSGNGEVASTGIDGLDNILMGGFARRRLYLIEGAPGSGKTTLATQFLLDGARRNEPVLYVTLSETGEEMQAVATSHAWDTSRLQIRELAPPDSLDPDDQYTMFQPSEIELAATTKLILADVQELNPTRVVFDSLSELRLLAGSALRYRRQILALKQFFAGRDCTVLMLDDMTATDHDLQVQSIAHGVIMLEQLSPEYGMERRRLRVLKYRGVRFRGGYHDYIIEKGGLKVFPRLVAAESRKATVPSALPSGIAELDALLGGGLDEGSSTLLIGSAGTGKSTLATQFVVAAAERGQKSAMFVFDENPATLINRCNCLDIKLESCIASGDVVLTQIDPAELSPGEFAAKVQHAAEVSGASLIVIDSLNGYLNAMPEERFLTAQLHEMLMYLGHRNVAVIVIGAHQGLIGTQMSMPIDASYLSDTVILLRFFESAGEVRQAISVVKKRNGAHERTIREFDLKHGGIRVGKVLRDFRGVLTGVPIYEGKSRSGNPQDQT